MGGRIKIKFPKLKRQDPVFSEFVHEHQMVEFGTREGLAYESGYEPRTSNQSTLCRFPLIINIYSLPSQKLLSNLNVITDCIDCHEQ
jgi:hypothetical protein